MLVVFALCCRAALEALPDGDGMREWRQFREVFPSLDCTFRVHRQMAVDWRAEEEERLVLAAEAGAPLSEILTNAPEGQLSAARRVLQLYRRGVLSPRAPKGALVGETCNVVQLMELTRTLLDEGSYEAAAAVAGQALEIAPVPEASALYRQAEARMAEAV